MGLLFAWIDRGEVNRRTANQFYSMIQLANGHVRRLMVEKAQEEEEVERAKEAYKSALLAVLTQCKSTSSLLTVSQQAAGAPGEGDFKVSSGPAVGGVCNSRLTWAPFLSVAGGGGVLVCLHGRPGRCGLR